jgi:hypothetical protein
VSRLRAGDTLSLGACLGVDKKVKQTPHEPREPGLRRSVKTLAVHWGVCLTFSYPQLERFQVANRLHGTIAEAQRKRWAAAKGQVETKAPKVAKPVKTKRVLSAAGKAAIVAALKKRWAAKKAAAKK